MIKNSYFESVGNKLKQKRSPIRSSFLILLLDYVSIKKEALPSLYAKNVQITFDI